MSLSFYIPHYQIESISKNYEFANVLTSCLYNVVHMLCVKRDVLTTVLADLAVLHSVRSVVTKCVVTNIRFHLYSL